MPDSRGRISTWPVSGFLVSAHQSQSRPPSPMSLVDIRVELPAFSRTINVQVPDSCTILDVKREIHRICVGAPRVEGQRIIWRGRSLLDTEKVQELWQASALLLPLHLAVYLSSRDSLLMSPALSTWPSILLPGLLRHPKSRSRPSPPLHLCPRLHPFFPKHFLPAILLSSLSSPPPIHSRMFLRDTNRLSMRSSN